MRFRNEWNVTSGYWKTSPSIKSASASYFASRFSNRDHSFSGLKLVAHNRLEDRFLKRASQDFFFLFFRINTSGSDLILTDKKKGEWRILRFLVWMWFSVGTRRGNIMKTTKTKSLHVQVEGKWKNKVNASSLRFSDHVYPPEFPSSCISYLFTSR